MATAEGLPFGNVFSGKKIAITGHTGFKGSWLVLWLHGLGAEICGISNGVPTSPSLFEEADLGSLIEHHVVDVRDLGAVDKVLTDFKPDFLFHLAAQPIVSKSYMDPIETLTTNVVGTANLLECARKFTWPCSVIIITSDKAYDNVEWEWGYREIDPLGGKDVYSGSKGAAELVVKCYYHSFFAAKKPGLRLASARAGNVIGGGDWAMDRIVVDCIRAWGDEKAVVIRSPNATRPWQHVLEPLSGYLRLAQRLWADPELSGQAYNFGPPSEQNRRVIDLIKDIAQVWGLNPTEAFALANDTTFHEAQLLKLNCDKALADLRWVANLSYDETVHFTGDWYRRVVKEGGNARSLTLEHIDSYQKLAEERRRVWMT